MEYASGGPGTLILNVHALRTPAQAVVSEIFKIDPYIKAEELISPQNENRLVRFEIPEKSEVRVIYSAVIDNCCEIKDFSDIAEMPVAQTDATVLPFLYPSRYCQSDKLYRLANNMFGHIENPFEKVHTLTKWINENVQYLSGSTNSQTSAFDTFTERAGVCRDFAHLGIAFCRALTIPARYFTGYAYKLKPADFHACFEAYIGTDWVLFDATGLAPLNGLVKIASGRDAADTAIANIFGDVIFKSMMVNCEVAGEGFIPFQYEGSQLSGVIYP